MSDQDRRANGPHDRDRVRDVRIEGLRLSVDLEDGRTISVPLEWYPRLAAANTDQLANWRISAAGFAIHWPEVDEDLSVEGLLRGTQAATS